jgi:hypothetical protein
MPQRSKKRISPFYEEVFPGVQKIEFKVISLRPAEKKLIHSINGIPILFIFFVPDS